MKPAKNEKKCESKTRIKIRGSEKDLNWSLTIGNGGKSYGNGVYW